MMHLLPPTSIFGKKPSQNHLQAFLRDIFRCEEPKGDLYLLYTTKGEKRTTIIQTEETKKAHHTTGNTHIFY
jgi:hypothetical protein